MSFGEDSCSGHEGFRDSEPWVQICLQWLCDFEQVLTLLGFFITTLPIKYTIQMPRVIIFFHKIKTMQIESFKWIILSTSLPQHEGSLWHILERFVQFRLKWPRQSDFYHLFWEAVSLIFSAHPSFWGSLQLNRQGEENVEQHYKNVNF